MLKGNVMTNIKTIFNTKYQSQQYGLILSKKNLTEHTGIQYKLRVSGIVHDSKKSFPGPSSEEILHLSTSTQKTSRLSGKQTQLCP